MVLPARPNRKLVDHDQDQDQRGGNTVPDQPSDSGDRVSRNPRGHGSNVVYQRLRDRGYQVFAVNPSAESVEGDPCFPDLQSIPEGVDAVVIGTSADRAEATMREAADLGITQVWMHRSLGAGSVSEAATAYGRQHGITVIDGGCPLMFEPTADAGHKAMCLLLTLTGKVPRRV